MMRKITFRSIVQSVVLVIAGLVIGLLLLGDGFVDRSLASADLQANAPMQVETAGPANPASPNTPIWKSCVPLNVATFDNRVHVECAAPLAGYRFYAAPTSNPAHAARILSTLSAAQVAGRTLSILYEPSDTSGASFGCQAGDCRTILAAGFGQ